MSTTPPDDDLPGFEPDDTPFPEEASTEAPDDSSDEKAEQIAEARGDGISDEEFEAWRWWRSLGKRTTDRLRYHRIWGSLESEEKVRLQKDVESGLGLKVAWKKLLAGLVVVSASSIAGCQYYKVTRATDWVAPEWMRSIESAEVVEATGPAVEATESTSEQLDELTEEQIDEILFDPGFPDCPIGFQQDIIGRVSSRQTDPVAESPAETDAEKAANPICTKAETTNSYLFTMILEGDGEWLSAQEYTSYQVRFNVNNEWPGNSFYDDTGFEVFIWLRGETGYTAEVKDSGWMPFADAEVEVEWVDPSTLQAHVTLPGADVELIEMRTEIYIYATEEDGTFLYDNLDVAIWNADQ